MSDIQTAIKQITAARPQRQKFIDYYDGNHHLAFASEKFINTFGQTLKAMRENLCQICVDAPADRMEIINFSSGETKETATKAWEIWQRELMELYSTDIHRDAFKCADAYLIVWVNEDNQAEFSVQEPTTCAVVYDENSKKALFGAKLWMTEEKRIRLTLYYADRIEKWITQKTYKSGITQQLKESHFIEIDADSEEFSTLNPYDTIPMFHFTAEPILANAIPVQDRLNKTICDELVAQEFAAYPQRYATGLELPVNTITGQQEMPFKAGIDRLWFTADKETSFGQFLAANLEQFLKVENEARLSVARVTGTPLHFFSFTTSDAISGEALKTLESRFTKRVKRTCISFGATWGNAMKFALQIEGTTTDSSLTTQWESPEQRSDAEMLDNLGKKKNVLEVPVDTLLEEYGYPVEDVAKFGAAREEAAKKEMEKLKNAPPPMAAQANN